MDVCDSFVAHAEAAVLSQPSEGAFDHPTMSSEPLFGLHTDAGGAVLDVALGTSTAATGEVVALVGMQLRGSPPRSPPTTVADRRYGIEHRVEEPGVVRVRRTRSCRQRRAGGVHDQMVLGTGACAVRRVRAELFAPLFAGTLRASTQARLQSIRSARAKRRSSSWCNRSQTPARCQSRSRRQQVTPPPQPGSAGSAIHGIPVCSTNTMPVKAARSSTSGRPPMGCGRCGGSKGSTIAHRSSSISFFMPRVKHSPCPGYETRSKQTVVTVRGLQRRRCSPWGRRGDDVRSGAPHLTFGLRRLGGSLPGRFDRLGERHPG